MPRIALHIKTYVSGLVFVWMVSAGCDGNSPDLLRLLPPAMLNFPTHVIIDRDIPYSRRGDDPLLLDLYRPVRDSTESLPLIVLIHGGAWDSGSRHQVAEYAYDFAANGYVAAAIDYRLTDQDTSFPDPLADVFAAVNDLRQRAAEFTLDPDRIALFGLSAGAHLALMAGLPNDASNFDPGLKLWSFPHIRAVVEIAGPTNFAVAPSQLPDYLARTIEYFLNRALEDAQTLLAAASPVRYVRADGPWVLAIHGDKDETVPVAQAYALADALSAAGQPHELQIIPGMGHLEPGIWVSPAAQDIRLRVLKFLDAALRPAGHAKDQSTQ